MTKRPTKILAFVTMGSLALVGCIVAITAGRELAVRASAPVSPPAKAEVRFFPSLRAAYANWSREHSYLIGPASQSQRHAAIALVRAQLDYCRAGNFGSAADEMFEADWHTPSGHTRFRSLWLACNPELAHYRSVSFGKSVLQARYVFLYSKVLGTDGKVATPTYIVVQSGRQYAIGQIIYSP